MAKSESILIIEDDAVARKVLAARLSTRDGYEVLVAETGEKGLKIAKKTRPDLILLDWRLPKMTGLEVISKLKSDSATQNIPVFMLTGKIMMRHAEKAINQGADAYFTKPMSLSHLSQRIGRTLNLATA